MGLDTNRPDKLNSVNTLLKTRPHVRHCQKLSSVEGINDAAAQLVCKQHTNGLSEDTNVPSYHAIATQVEAHDKMSIKLQNTKLTNQSINSLWSDYMFDGLTPSYGRGNPKMIQIK